MRRGFYFLLAAILVMVSLAPTGYLAYAQGPGSSSINVVPIPVPQNWYVYQEANGAWWLKYPNSWIVSDSQPGEVTFQVDGTQVVEIVVEADSFGIPYDNWLLLDLVLQGVMQSLASQEQPTQMMEVGHWFRGVFGLYFAMQRSDPQMGLTTPVTVVMMPFGSKQVARASFSLSSPEEKDTVGAVLSSLTAGPAPAGAIVPPVQQENETKGPQIVSSTPDVSSGMLGMTGPSFGPIIFAEGLNAQNQPVNPGTTFASGITAVYGIFDYSRMPASTEYAATWYMNETMVFSDNYRWDLPETGTGASVLLSNSNGFPDGQYELELSISGQVVQQGAFGVGERAVQSTPITFQTPVPLLIQTPVATPVQVIIPTPEPTPAPPTPVPPPRVSSRQAKIVYTQFDGDVPSLWTINVDGSGDTRIKGADHASDPAWAPDGTTIVFVGWDGNPRGGSGIYTMNPDGSNVKLIWNEGTASYLDWSLPGRYVALTSIVAGSDHRRIIVYDGKDGQWHDIGPGEQASFSPNADRLVAKSCVGGDCGLYVYNRDGSNKWRLTTSGDDAMAAWSPNGNRIAYASQRDGNWDIWAINVDGSGNTRLTDDPGIDAMPAWLPDGSGIVFRSSRGGSWGIWVMNADGSNPTKVVDSFAGNDWGRARLDVR